MKLNTKFNAVKDRPAEARRGTVKPNRVRANNAPNKCAPKAVKSVSVQQAYMVKNPKTTHVMKTDMITW